MSGFCVTSTSITALSHFCGACQCSDGRTLVTVMSNESRCAVVEARRRRRRVDDGDVRAQQLPEDEDAALELDGPEAARVLAVRPGAVLRVALLVLALAERRRRDDLRGWRRQLGRGMWRRVRSGRRRRQGFVLPLHRGVVAWGRKRSGRRRGRRGRRSAAPADAAAAGGAGGVGARDGRMPGKPHATIATQGRAAGAITGSAPDRDAPVSRSV